MAVTGLTIGVATCTAQGDSIYATDYHRPVDSIRWYGATAKGATCKVTDAGGRIVFGARAEASFSTYDKYFSGGRTFNGVKVLSLGSGVVEVTFR